MKKISIQIETSARHAHLCEQDVWKLFGEGAKLTPKKWLSQPGMFLANERINLIGSRNKMKNVGIIGPERKDTQVEISLTDARSLGVVAPVRESGDIEGTGTITIEGPMGSVDIPQGVIAAKRHIHITPEDAAEYGLADQQIVTVKTSGDRSMIFDEVVVRVSPNFATYMHIDVDEANAAGLTPDSVGEIIV